MTLRDTLRLAAIALTLTAAAAHAMPSAPPPPPPSSGPATVPGSGTAPGSGASTMRQQAEQDYALAYEEVGKANQDLEDGKAKNAEKKFKRALERCRRAVSYDERYHEAWNLIGYTSRKLNDYDAAFQAYEKCLAISPEYAPAHEYLGEAWLEKGDVKKARAQVDKLEYIGAVPEAAALKKKIEAWAAAHPAAAPDSSATPAPAPADSSAGSGR
jgi:Flp pilus assembly protein TadD